MQIITLSCRYRNKHTFKIFYKPAWCSVSKPYTMYIQWLNLSPFCSAFIVNYFTIWIDLFIFLLTVAKYSKSQAHSLLHKKCKMTSFWLLHFLFPFSSKLRCFSSALKFIGSFRINQGLNAEKESLIPILLIIFTYWFSNGLLSFINYSRNYCTHKIVFS